MGSPLRRITAVAAAIHVVCLVLTGDRWIRSRAACAFVVPSPSATSTLLFPRKEKLVSLTTRGGDLFSKVNGKSDEKQGGFRSIISRILQDGQRGNADEKRKDMLRQRKEDLDDDDEGLLNGIVKRLSGRTIKRNDNNSSEERQLRWRLPSFGVGEDRKQDESTSSSDTSTEAMENSERKVSLLETIDRSSKELRTQLSKIRSSDYMEDAVRDGYLLTEEEEAKRIEQLRLARIEQRRRQEEKRQQLEEERREAARRKQEERLEALKERRRVKEEQQMQFEKEKEAAERQRRIRDAAKQAEEQVPVNGNGPIGVEPTLGRFSITAPDKSVVATKSMKSSETTSPISTPTSSQTKSPLEKFLTNALLARKNNDTDIENNNGSVNPLGAAKKMFSNMWESRFGSSREQWVVVFPKSRLDPGEVVAVNVAGLDLLVVASITGNKLYCIANSCPHLGTPLETGPLKRKPAPPGKSTSSDGCEDTIRCPLHQTSFALETGEVRGEWCPYPPVLGKMMGAVKTESPLAVFDIRTKGKNVEVKINSKLDLWDDDGDEKDDSDKKAMKKGGKMNEKLASASP